MPCEWSLYESNRVRGGGLVRNSHCSFICRDCLFGTCLSTCSRTPLPQAWTTDGPERANRARKQLPKLAVIGSSIGFLSGCLEYSPTIHYRLHRSPFKAHDTQASNTLNPVSTSSPAVLLTNLAVSTGTFKKGLCPLPATSAYTSTPAPLKPCTVPVCASHGTALSLSQSK